jgi:L-fuconolactonase
MLITDAHTHVWHSAMSHGDPRATIVSPVDEISPALLAGYMDEEGVARAVLVQPVCSGEDNSRVCDQARESPERFAAVCVVDPRQPGVAGHLARWAEAGCRGLRLRPLLAPSVLDGLVDTEVWAQVLSSRLVVNIVGGVENLDDIYTLARSSPEVPILLDHMAYPDVHVGTRSEGFRRLLRLGRLPNVFVKLSGYYYFSGESYPYRDCWAIVRGVYDSFGPRRLLWGSDFPHCLLRTGYRRQVELASSYFEFIDRADLAEIMSGTAERLYWGHAEGATVAT